jgi:hypothetical protein
MLADQLAAKGLDSTIGSDGSTTLSFGGAAAGPAGDDPHARYRQQQPPQQQQQQQQQPAHVKSMRTDSGSASCMSEDSGPCSAASRMAAHAAARRQAEYFVPPDASAQSITPRPHQWLYKEYKLLEEIGSGGFGRVMK